MKERTKTGIKAKRNLRTNLRTLRQECIMEISAREENDKGLEAIMTYSFPTSRKLRKCQTG
jgi:hypothetical protein